MAINVPQNYCTCFAPHHGCSTEFAVVRIKGTDLMLVSAAGMPAAPNFPGGRCWTSHAVRFADNTILSYLINVVPSIQCCVPVFSSGLRSAVRRRLTSGRTVVSVVRINSDIIGELTRQHCVHLYGSYAFRTSYR